MKNEIKDLLHELRIKQVIIDYIKKSIDSGYITSIEIDKTTVVKIGVNYETAYNLYCSDFLRDSSSRNLTLIDIIYSDYNNSGYMDCKNYADNFIKKILHNGLDLTVDGDNVSELICFLFFKANEYKYQHFNSIEEFTEPVPMPVFTNLLTKTKKGMPLLLTDGEVEYAGAFEKIITEKNQVGQIEYFVKVSVITRNATGYSLGKTYCRIYPKAFCKTIEDLGLVALTDEKQEEFENRAKKYLTRTSMPCYCEYHGEAWSQGYRGDICHRLDGRIMIDIESFRLINPNTEREWFFGNPFRNNSVSLETVSEMAYLCIPYVYGFSFSNKVWCRMKIEDISDIEFSETAFDDLIIPQDHKDMFIATLTTNMPSFDSISEKGEGKIFLLSGGPGIGKTMSAEAVAEFLKKPLYFVSVGELGISPSDLEENLDKVMKVATSWDAIVLLDEVDIFAAKRTVSTSLEKNAMTAIFLRMLERYSGILFMTTNLLDNIDPAFKSRSTAILKYKDLDTESKKAIWLNLFDKTEKYGLKVSNGLKCYDVDSLAKRDLNGRTIKSTMRLAYGLAVANNDAVLTHDHIKKAISLRHE